MPNFSINAQFTFSIYEKMKLCSNINLIKNQIHINKTFSLIS